MREHHLRCQFGKASRRPGMKGRPGSCDNRASGLWEVKYKRRQKVRLMLLCADCAFQRIPELVSMVLVNDEPVYYRPIESIRLVQSLNTTFEQAKARPGPSAKHWVQPDPLPEIPAPLVVTRYVPKDPKMDMATYLKSLSSHDDGR